MTMESNTNWEHIKAEQEKKAKKAWADVEALFVETTKATAAELRKRDHKVRASVTKFAFWSRATFTVDGRDMPVELKAHTTHPFSGPTVPTGRFAARIGYHYPHRIINSKKGKFSPIVLASAIEKEFAESDLNQKQADERCRVRDTADGTMQTLATEFNLSNSFGARGPMYVDDSLVMKFDKLTLDQARALLSAADCVGLLDQYRETE
jgi:hypothetical protein